MSTKLQPSDKAIDFKLLGDDNKEHTLDEFKGKKLILYFYPKDNTPGCTREAVGFSDYYEEIKKLGAEVVGISPDSVNSHKKFKEKHGIKFLLLSDPEKKVAESYGAFGEKKMYGKVTKGIIRSTFIIDENSIIIKSFYNVKVNGHVEKVVEFLKGLANE
ncbi:thioredoxin-dependent thiol peroxidase [Deferribacter autotrophicus]|uniref:thioredoxin-dependent peroxiredoxin n=1 Tax=Deferribacter autotrophicus TaxID=500465 RepID=A0A5A8F6Q0_9BACT|nr:thioredoxin-dependent thiol peroxidase [Deferribacter autotrophicus]KAA0259158.1 thioredoxin-dependent thiol peroxidase [Deferribacter autotrophicus]